MSDDLPNREQVDFIIEDRDHWIRRYEAEAAKTARLMRIVKDTLWMAQRYADGRMSYAVGMYNDAARDARSLGIDEPDAKDGMFDTGRSLGDDQATLTHPE